MACRVYDGRMRSLVVALALTACTASSPSATTDALPACTQAVYDPCNTEHDCMSGNCHLFMMDNLQVCTQVCSATNPCPNDATGAAVACNSMGLCKPAIANRCNL